MAFEEFLPRGTIFIAEYSGQLQVERAFPSLERLLYAARLLGEDRLDTEQPEGIEIARNTLQMEMDARTQHETTDFCSARLRRLLAEYTVVTSRISPENPDPELIQRIKTYTIALQPQMGLEIITADLRYRNGEDGFDDNNFSDLTGSISLLPPQE